MKNHRKIPRKNPRRSHRKPLSTEEIEKLIQAAKSIRDRLVIAMPYYTGLRVSELSNLKLDDVDTEKGLIRVMGLKIRWVRCSEEHLGTLVDSWLRERKSCVNAEHVDYFFVSGTGRKLSLRAIHRIVHKAAVRAGIQEVRGKAADGKPIYKVAPHLLRRTFAAHALEDGTRPEDICHFMGGASPSVTMAYSNARRGCLCDSYEKHFKGASARRTRRPRSKVRKAKRGEKA